MSIKIVMFRWMFFFLLFFTEVCQAEYKYRLAVCAIFQDEALYLKEWIEFHRLVGVDHFYLYNHRSRDNYQEVLKPYILSGLVELFNKPKVANRVKIFNRLQCKCYNECLAQARGISKWVAFIDIDEYLFPTRASSLPDVLKQYENFGGVCVNWRIFGTSHLQKAPKEQLLIESFTLCTTKNFSANRYVKSIVRPECASHFPNPHHPIYLKGYFQVDTDKIPFKGPFLSTYVQNNKLCINHYWTRDEDFFYRKKIPRQKKWGGMPIAKDIIYSTNLEKDEMILRFVPALKEVMSLSQK